MRLCLWQKLSVELEVPTIRPHTLVVDDYFVSLVWSHLKWVPIMAIVSLAQLTFQHLLCNFVLCRESCLHFCKQDPGNNELPYLLSLVPLNINNWDLRIYGLCMVYIMLGSKDVSLNYCSRSYAQLYGQKKTGWSFDVRGVWMNSSIGNVKMQRVIMQPEHSQYKLI